MLLAIKTINNEIQLVLKKEGKIVDRALFSDKHNLTEELLPAIERLIAKNKLDRADISKVRVDSDMPDSFTTARIAKIVANAINWAGSHKSH